jgi:hypothetical protein
VFDVPIDEGLLLKFDMLVAAFRDCVEGLLVGTYVFMYAGNERYETGVRNRRKQSRRFQARINFTKIPLGAGVVQSV